MARAQLAHKLDQQAFATLREAVLRNGNSPAAVDAYFLMASIQEKQKPEDAMATYVQIADRFTQHARAPEALFRLAETTRRSRRPNRHADARTVLIDLVERYPRSAWVVRALVAKADIEEREEIRELDTLLGAPAAAALATWRQVAARDDGQAEREMALWKLGTLYEDAKQYDLAVEALTTLAERYPETRHDAWAGVARLCLDTSTSPSPPIETIGVAISPLASIIICGQVLMWTTLTCLMPQSARPSRQPSWR